MGLPRGGVPQWAAWPANESWAWSLGKIPTQFHPNPAALKPLAGFSK